MEFFLGEGFEEEARDGVGGEPGEEVEEGLGGGGELVEGGQPGGGDAGGIVGAGGVVPGADEFCVGFPALVVFGDGDGDGVEVGGGLEDAEGQAV